MFERLEKTDWKKFSTFAGGVLFGTAGIRVLSSADAKKVYTAAAAALLRAKDCMMDRVTILQENAEDIYEGALRINEDRAGQTVYEDQPKEKTEVE